MRVKQSLSPLRQEGFAPFDDGDEPYLEALGELVADVGTAAVRTMGAPSTHDLALAALRAQIRHELHA